MVVSLEDLYRGTIRTVQIRDQRMCLHCKYNILPVTSRAAQMEFRRNCTRCQGSGTEDSYRNVRVKIKCGMRHSERIIFKEGGTRCPGKKPGDIIITIMEKNHSECRRRGNDLYLRMSLSKKQIKFGCQKVILTLDGRKLPLTILPAEKCGTNTILGEGMPIAKNETRNGQLIVEYVIGKFSIKTTQNISIC